MFEAEADLRNAMSVKDSKIENNCDSSVKILA